MTGDTPINYHLDSFIAYQIHLLLWQYPNKTEEKNNNGNHIHFMERAFSSENRLLYLPNGKNKFR